jgi:hypothetical protein
LGLRLRCDLAAGVAGSAAHSEGASGARRPLKRACAAAASRWPGAPAPSAVLALLQTTFMGI